MTLLLSKYGTKTSMTKLPLANKMRIMTSFYTQRILPKEVVGDQSAARTSVKKHLHVYLLMSGTSGTTGRQRLRLPQMV